MKKIVIATVAILAVSTSGAFAKHHKMMKPKDAAKVFDRLEMSVLFEIASQIAPRKMSDILGLMQPDAAERLTVEMARRAGGDKMTPGADLPKIEGRIISQKGLRQ